MHLPKDDAKPRPPMELPVEPQLRQPPCS